MAKTKPTPKKRSVGRKRAPAKTKATARSRNMFIALFAFAVVLVCGILLLQPLFAASPSKRKHITLNIPGGDYKKTASLGYNVLDVGMDIGEVNALPKGTQGIVWVGNTQCANDFAVSYNRFTAFVKKHANNSRIWGYYLSDEPDGSRCPGIVKEIKKRADYIHKYAPKHKAFVALTDWPYKPVNQAATHADVFGLDPYPCEIGKKCNLDLINKEVTNATKAGVPKDKIIPTFQAFGQTCNGKGEDKKWRLPSESEMKAILARWDKVLPKAIGDVTYTWGDPWNSCPSLKKANGTGGYPNLQKVMKDYNSKH